MKKIVLFLLFAAVAVPAGDPQGFRFWTSAELKSYAKKLSPKIDAQKVASEQLANFGNYLFAIAHREGPGEAEVHATLHDIFIPQSGEATLIYGGTVVNGRTTAPNEIRGASIKGGMEKKLVPGDVVTIPAKLPHQLILPAGKEFTYFYVKIAAQ
jgi:hypothetical protein